jgi:lipoprotein-anchoring transpeptidase ErfK/SrfK
MVIRDGGSRVTDLLSTPMPSAEAPSDHEQHEAAPVTVVWLPAKKATDKGVLALSLGIPAGILAVAASICAAILIAPGVMVAGADIGWRTPGFASAVVTASLADTRVTFETESGQLTLTGEELGLSVDAKSLTQLAYADYPLWNVGAWNPGDIPLAVTVDKAAAHAALSAAAPTVFPAPVAARVVFDETLVRFQPVNAESGLSVNLGKLTSAVSAALSSGSRIATIDATPVLAEAAVSSTDAKKLAGTLNALIASAGFYVDGVKAVGVDSKTAASWLTVRANDGTLRVDFDEKAALADITPVVAGLSATVNRPAVDEVIVTNSAGDHLRTVQAGVDGWKLVSTGAIAAGFVDSFAIGDGRYELKGIDTAFPTTLAYRSIEVDKSAGLTILYENGQVVDTYPVAVGRPETATDEGRFTVYGQLTIQDMGCSEGFDYCTTDVPWITYFNGDEGFHGTYWHNNFGPGAMMSHGCVNMTISAAERLYRFAQVGTEIWVHS